MYTDHANRGSSLSSSVRSTLSKAWLPCCKVTPKLVTQSGTTQQNDQEAQNLVLVPKKIFRSEELVQKKTSPQAREENTMKIDIDVVVNEGAGDDTAMLLSLLFDVKIILSEIDSQTYQNE